MRFKNIWTEANVIEITEVAANVRLFEIEPAGGIEWYNAGAHLQVSVLIDGLPDIRSYSLVGTYQAGGRYCIAVKRLAASRGGSAYMWTLEPGARLSISQPQNHFQLTFGRSGYILMAGGIGITPLYGMALELAEKGADFRLLYAGASRREMPFITELEQRLGDRLTIYASDEGQRIDIEREMAAITAGTQLYVCAPLRMLDATRQAWHNRGLPPGDLRFETFAASGRFAPQSFRVSVPRFEVNVTVPANQSMLEALSQAGVEVMFDCLRGECGLCAVDILEASGTVDHRDMFFSDHQKNENKKMCACVSRVVEGDVIIDTAYRGRRSKI